MRNLLVGLAILSSLSVTGASHAAIGTVEMAWDGCTGPIDKASATPGLYSIYITVIGHDQPQKAYDVRIIYSNASQTVPDAWRFDAAGCEGSAAITQDVTSKVCPPFSQGAAGALQIKKVQFSPPWDQYPLTMMQVLLANSYPAVNVVDPATRYFLERIQFDLNDAVPGAGSPPTTCGGFEQQMFFRFSYTSWLDPNGNELLFNRSSPPLTLTFNGSTPAQATTWGSIKSQYRN